MIREARNDRGLRLPTLGSAGLREFAAVRTKKSDRLSDLAAQALNSGDLMAAERLGQGAIANSNNPEITRTILTAIAKPQYRVQAKAKPQYPVQESPFDPPADIQLESTSPFDSATVQEVIPKPSMPGPSVCLLYTSPSPRD